MTDFLDTLKPATQKQVRAHYEKRGFQTRIASDGHVRYRYRSVYRSKRDTSSWLEGGYVDRYHVDGRGEVHLI